MSYNKKQPHTISSLRAHTRASASFRFSSSPFTPPSHHFVSQCVRCEGKAYFILHLPLHPRNEGKTTFTEKSHLLFLRRKVEKCGGFRPKVFTQKQLIHNHLRKMGEEVKAKNEKPLCAHYARARPPHLHSEHRGTSTSSRRARVIVRVDRRLPARHAPIRPIFSTKITG